MSGTDKALYATILYTFEDALAIECANILMEALYIACNPAWYHFREFHRIKEFCMLHNPKMSRAH